MSRGKFSNTIKGEKMRLVLLFAIVGIIGGCAKSSPILKATESASNFDDAVYSGSETVLSETPEGVTEYRIFHQGATGFVSVQSLRDSVENRAWKFCDEKGGKLLRLREHTSNPPHVAGNFPRLELIFGCI